MSHGCHLALQLDVQRLYLVHKVLSLLLLLHLWVCIPAFAVLVSGLFFCLAAVCCQLHVQFTPHSCLLICV